MSVIHVDFGQLYMVQSKSIMWYVIWKYFILSPIAFAHLIWYEYILHYHHTISGYNVSYESCKTYEKLFENKHAWVI